MVCSLPPGIEGGVTQATKPGGGAALAADGGRRPRGAPPGFPACLRPLRGARCNRNGEKARLRKPSQAIATERMRLGGATRPLPWPAAALAIALLSLLSWAGLAATLLALLRE